MLRTRPANFYLRVSSLLLFLVAFTVGCERQVEADPSPTSSTTSVIALPSLTPTSAASSPTPSSTPDTSTSRRAATSIAVSTESSTITPEPTVVLATPTVTTGQFDVETGSRSVPDDVLEEVFLALGGAGGGSLCSDAGQEPYVFPAKPIEINEIAMLAICDWDGAETTVVLIFPDGSQQMIQAHEVGIDQYESSLLRIRFQPGIEDPIGTYTFRFPYNGTTAEQSFEVVEPVGARVYLYENEDKERTGELRLYNFQPGETVRLFAYQIAESDQGQLIDWEEFRVSDKGQRLIYVPEDSEIFYAAVGDLSGEAETHRVNPIIGLYPVFTQNNSILR